MKKLALLLCVIAITQITSCKKEYCWVCTSTVTGNDEEACGMTKKEAERKEGSGYTCVKK